ncbi:MAG: insulinase family protein [Pseudonocardiales bacterium]|nr:insulinase family protein [Pseudonocardiales bacterium]
MTATTTSGHRSAGQIGRTEAGPRPLPPLATFLGAPVPDVVDATVSSGLRVLAVRRPTVPMVELRLRVPFADSDPAHTAQAELLSSAMLTGTQRRSRVELDNELATVGADLGVGVDPERLGVYGSALADGLPTMLDVLADVLTSAAYPPAEVDRERERLVERITVTRAQPRVIAREALQRRRYGDHPISREIPTGAEVEAVTQEQLRALHAGAVVPAGSTLVLVGDLDPEAVIGQVEQALQGWSTDHPATELDEPPLVRGDDLLLVHRPGAVQSQLRLSAAAMPRSDERYPAFQLANMVLGGYFSSRLVENLREDKGYTYSAYSAVEFMRNSGSLLVEADTATDVTAAALWEMRYELGRLGLVPPTTDEVDSARRYAIGSLLISLDSQAGLAGTLSALTSAGLDVEWLRRHPERLAAVTTEEVAAVAAEFFAPTAFTGVVVADVDATGERLRALGGVVGPESS